jgi:hypothetical protein
MKTGERFWQLIGFVFFILFMYGLMELSDALTARQAQITNLQQLLTRQENLVRDNHWLENAKAVENIKNAWLDYLPVEKTPTFAKAHLLSEVRNFARDAKINNLIVSATDAEGGEQTGNNANTKPIAKSSSTTRFAADKNKENVLPVGVQMIKLTISGRFDPAAFNSFLQKQADSQRFSVIERVTVRGAQLELGIRCYWRLDPANKGGSDLGKAVLPPINKGL